MTTILLFLFSFLFSQSDFRGVLSCSGVEDTGEHIDIGPCSVLYGKQDMFFEQVVLRQVCYRSDRNYILFWKHMSTEFVPYYGRVDYYSVYLLKRLLSKKGVPETLIYRKDSVEYVYISERALFPSVPIYYKTNSIKLKQSFNANAFGVDLFTYTGIIVYNLNCSLSVFK